MKKQITTEPEVKTLVKYWFDCWDSFSFAPVSNGMGVHGIPDRIGCVPVVVTPEMVGKTVGLFVAIEAKAPGRRHELYRGCSRNQVERLAEINKAAGFGRVVDGENDLFHLAEEIRILTQGE